MTSLVPFLVPCAKVSSVLPLLLLTWLNVAMGVSKGASLLPLDPLATQRIVKIGTEEPLTTNNGI